MKRGRQSESIDFGETDVASNASSQDGELESSAGVARISGPYHLSETLSAFHQQSYYHDFDGSSSIYPPDSQQKQSHNFSAATCIQSFGRNDDQRDSRPWHLNQSRTPFAPNSSEQTQTTNYSGFPQASNISDKGMKRAAAESETKKNKQETTLLTDHSSGHQILVSTNTSAVQDDGFGSLNRLIDRFIEIAEKGTNIQPRSLDSSTLTQPDELSQSRLRHTLPASTGDLGLGALPGSVFQATQSVLSNANYLPETNVDMHHQPVPSSLYPFPSHPTPSSNHHMKNPAKTSRTLTNKVSSSSNDSLYPPRSLAMPNDQDHLSPYQCLLRKQMQFFAADWDDIAVIQGRNKPVVRQQVGLRCIHCAHIPIKNRDKGSTYFSSRLDALYQSAQNLAKKHLLEKCRHVPTAIREQLLQLKRIVPVPSRPESKQYAPGRSGKGYWAEAAISVGVYEDQTNERLEFRY